MSAVAAVPDTDTATLEDLVFDATAVLATIRQAAHARLVVPWAVLGAALARVVAEVPPHVVLPPLVGSEASLNLAVALVSASGGGKSAAMGCARDVVQIADRRAQDIGPGSGEGLMMAFLEWDDAAKQNVVKADPMAVLTADEVAQIGAVQGRNSQATFGPAVRTMLTGGFTSTSAAEHGRRRKLDAHTYRLCVVAGVQPRLSDVLLDDTDAGTPQRWLWLPADDPDWDVPPTASPQPERWKLPRLPAAYGHVNMPVPAETEDAVRAARIRRLRREGDPLDGHRLLTREKVAAALALLHGDIKVTPQWWELAGFVMIKSDATRAYCQRELEAKREAEQRGRGRADVQREAGAREARASETERNARLVWRIVAEGAHTDAKHETDEGCTGRCVTRAVRHHKGVDKAAALALAIELEWVSERDGRYFPGVSQPAGARPMSTA